MIFAECVCKRARDPELVQTVSCRPCNLAGQMPPGARARWYATQCCFTRHAAAGQGQGRAHMCMHWHGVHAIATCVNNVCNLQQGAHVPALCAKWRWAVGIVNDQTGLWVACAGGEGVTPG